MNLYLASSLFLIVYVFGSSYTYKSVVPFMLIIKLKNSIKMFDFVISKHDNLVDHFLDNTIKNV